MAGLASAGPASFLYMEDLALRERFKKLVRALDARIASLESRLYLLSVEVAANEKYLTVTTHTELATRDASKYTAVFCLSNAAKDFGFYYPYSGPLAVNNTSILVDITGSKFQLKQ